MKILQGIKDAKYSLDVFKRILLSKAEKQKLRKLLTVNLFLKPNPDVHVRE